MRKYRPGLLLLVPLILSLPGCLQLGRQTAPAEAGALSGKYSSFDMGGVGIKIPLPHGYADAPAALRQTVQSLSQSEHVFAVYLSAADGGSARGGGAAALEQRKYLVVSARPEFMREIVDRAFFGAMRRDFVRTNGGFAPERLGQFKALAGNYYARDDAFSHSLGVYDNRAASISMVRIVRQADSRDRGARSLYAASSGAVEQEDRASAWQGWDSGYFSRAYHQVLIQNVLLLEGRCLNIYFAAPLAGEADVYAAMAENRAYIEALLSGLGAERGGEAPPGGGREAARNREAPSTVR